MVFYNLFKDQDLNKIGVNMSYLLAQSYLIFLIGVMISSGIMKKYNLLSDVFKYISDKIPTKRGVVALISLIGGVLPIPGRVTVSAGILSNLAPCCSNEDCNLGEKECRRARSKFGIIDYLSTHHYYLWSPLEKTVILPMAALGLSWGSFIGIVWPLILITFLYIIWFIFWRLKEEDIIINESIFGEYNIKRFISGFLPLVLGIIILASGILPGSIIFGLLAVYYIVLTKTYNLKEINSYINWWLVGLLSVVLILSVFFKSHNVEILQFIELYESVLDINTITGLLAISSFAFAASWLMGSSGKFAGIVALLVTIYGSHYLVWFLVLEFFAYNISPTHKCVPIGSMYFGTTIRRYFEAIIWWQILLLIWAFIVTFLL